VSSPSLRPTAAKLDLVAREAARADVVAVRGLLTAIGPLVVRYCRAFFRRRNGSYGAADELAREVCVSVLNAVPDYSREGGSFLFVLHEISSRTITDALRHRTDEPPEPMAELPVTQREVLVLRVALGLSVAETAEALGISPASVRLVQHGAIATLRSGLRRG
jgi:RNA polymerase sigma-70 factor (ECF subfamily)